MSSVKQITSDFSSQTLPKKRSREEDKTSSTAISHLTNIAQGASNKKFKGEQLQSASEPLHIPTTTSSIPLTLLSDDVGEEDGIDPLLHFENTDLDETDLLICDNVDLPFPQEVAPDSVMPSQDLEMKQARLDFKKYLLLNLSWLNIPFVISLEPHSSEDIGKLFKFLFFFGPNSGARSEDVSNLHNFLKKNRHLNPIQDLNLEIYSEKICGILLPLCPNLKSLQLGSEVCGSTFPQIVHRLSQLSDLQNLQLRNCVMNQNDFLDLLDLRNSKNIALEMTNCFMFIPPSKAGITQHAKYIELIPENVEILSKQLHRSL